MKKIIACIALLCLISFGTQAQTIQDLIDAVDIDNIMLTVNEFTGEQTTVVNGTTVTILNRQSNNNDIASEYLIQKFEAMDNMIITNQSFNSGGRNIIATQTGQTNPNDIYIISAHYDSVANYCADDNASGTAAILEIARILSAQCLDNTIKYALWDEEEQGLLGSAFYASNAQTNNENILGVLNIDMMGYDGNGDNKFDIDVRNNANSIAMKDDILEVLNTYAFNLEAVVVNPGTTASDHASFWDNGYSAVLVGESWETNDQTPFYHSANDRASTLTQPYYLEIAKLVMGYMATKGRLLAIDNNVSLTTNNTVLESDQPTGNYQWFDCTTDTEITGATNRIYTPTINGEYAVEVTVNGCTEKSECITFSTLGIELFSENELKLYPNPVASFIKIETPLTNIRYAIYDINGKVITSGTTNEHITSIDLKSIATGVYFVKINSTLKSKTYRILKE
jgi:hypothetical protein